MRETECRSIVVVANEFGSAPELSVRMGSENIFVVALDSAATFINDDVWTLQRINAWILGYNEGPKDMGLIGVEGIWRWVRGREVPVKENPESSVLESLGHFVPTGS